MAPRAPLHPRPPRHHHQIAQHSHHSNMIHVPQHQHNQHQHQHQHTPKPHHRSYKPRIHIPLLHGLHHRPSLLARLHPHYHHHHHPPHHHHHHGPHHHPGHQHNHHHPHAHHPQQQHQHQHHGRPGQQLVAGAQLPRLPQNGYRNPGMKPQFQQQQQQQQHQQPQQQHFGFPAIDATPSHTSPAASPAGPPKHGIRHFPNQPHFNFQQDPELPFGNEPVSELPSSAAPYHGPSTQSVPAGIQQTTSAYGETSPNPHGFLASTYKGWKPIAKPYQSSYPRAPEHQHQHQAGLPDFPRGPHGFPGSQGFPRGPPQDFPQLSDNHLQGFPIHDFPSGPTGPPSHQEFPRGPQGNSFDSFPHIPNPPQMQSYSRAPPSNGHHGPGNHLLDFAQFDGGSSGQIQPFPQGPPPSRAPPGHHRHHPQHHGLPGGKIQQYHEQTSSVPPNHPQYGIPPGHPSTTPRHEFPQFFPSGGAPVDNFNNLNTNTLFRENTANMNPHHHQQINGHGHPLNSQSVEVALPPEIGDTVRLPNSIFQDNTWTQSNRDQPFETSQSEENIVIKKPKFGGRHKLNQGGPPSPSSAGSSDETIESQGPPSILPKFRPRPRPNKNNDGEKPLGSSLGHQDSENDGAQKLSGGSDEGFDGGSGQNLKTKLNNGRGRVRIRTRLRRPNPFQNSGDDHNDSSPGHGTSSRPFPPFPGAKLDPRPRHPFRKQPSNNSPPHDNSISTETPNSSAGEDHGPPGPPGGPGIKGPISEELSNFPTLPFPPPDPDFIRDFPSPVSHAPVSPPPPPPPPPSPPKEREHSRLPPPFGRQPVGIRGSTESSEHGNLGPSPPPPPPPPPRDNSHPGPRPHLRRRRPKQPPKIQQEQHDHHDEQEHSQHDQKQHQQQGNHGGHGNDLNNPPSIGLSQSLFSDEFFFPPGFNADPSKHNPGDNPVSFITMPNAKPHIIHHNIVQQQQQQQHHHTPSSTEQNHRPQVTPQQNIFHGPSTQHFPPLDDFGQQNIGINNLPYNNRHQHLPQGPPHQNHHHRGHPNPQNVQLSAFSDHLPFGRHPGRGRKPMRGNHPKGPPPPPPPPVHNPYAYPSPNPYAIAGQYIPPTGHQMIDSAPQTSNSYEIPEGAAMFNSQRQPQNGPVYHPPTHSPPPPPPPPTQQQINHHRHQHHGPQGMPALPHKHAIGIPVPSSLPPPRHIPMNHGPPPARGRFPGRGPHRKPIVPALVDPLGSQSAEFEQIPAQYVDVNAMGSTTPSMGPPTVPVVTQARPVFSKPHVHHSPDIHPPGSFFDDFFKPFDDAFGQSPQGNGVTQRSDGDPMHDEHQSQSDHHVNVVPSPKVNQSQEAGPNKGNRKHWSKLKVTAKDEKSTPSSVEKPGRIQKKPIGGRLNNPNNKNHLKAKIADIARKNFQSHMGTNGEGHEGGVDTVTTYKPALLDSDLVSNRSHGTDGEHGHATSHESTTAVKVIPTWKDPEDDITDSNTPKSVRFGTKTEAGPMLIHHRNRNNDNDQDGTTILFKSKRQFRRKRPGHQEKEEHDDQPTSRPSPLRQAKEEIEHNHSGDTEDHGNIGGPETTRVGVIRRRKLFPRRRNFSLSSKTGKDTEASTTPDAAEAESVTYGEGQWFRVKKFDSHEEDKVTHTQHGRTLEKDSLSSPVPTPESKTAVESASPTDEEIHSNFESSKSRKNLHSDSTTSSVSSSVSSSSSSSSSSASRDGGFGKKSSKFLMNRLAIA